MADEKYEKASLELESLLFTSRATALHDDVLYSLAEAYFLSGQYLLAAEMYGRLLEQVPDSPYLSTARFMLARSHEELSANPELDQEHTRKAVEEFALYLDLYGRRDPEVVSRDVDTYRELLRLEPANIAYRQRYEAAGRELARADSVSYAAAAIPALREKLASGLYLVGKQYLQLKKYKAAAIYFEEVLRRYPESEWFHPSWVGTIKALTLRGKWFDARRALDQYLERYPDRLEQVRGLREEILGRFSAE